MRNHHRSDQHHAGHDDGPRQRELRAAVGQREGRVQHVDKGLRGPSLRESTGDTPGCQERAKSGRN